MSAHRIARPIALSLLAFVGISHPREGEWNTQRAKLVAGTTATASQISIASGMATRDDITLADGTIEADVNAPVGPGFAGFAFRVANTADYEIIYFVADSSRWGGLQYQPVFEGEPTWQLYPGDGFLGDIPESQSARNQPLHVKIVFAGTRADVYVNHSTTAVLRIPELKRDRKAGIVGVWVAPVASNVTYSNYTATSRVDLPLASIAAAPAMSGQIMRWRVSNRLPSPDTIVAPRALSSEQLRAVNEGIVANAETDGLVNLSRIVGNPAGPQIENVLGGAGWGLALASVTLNANSDHTAGLQFNYSDGISVFLNGKRVFDGTRPYASADLGRIMGTDSSVELPLKRGANKLVLAVTDHAWGWGFRARLVDAAGATTAVP
ncbi:MAG: hypothetical protein ABJB66_02780 [Gemmatimonadaceae bacterium]